MIRSVFIDGPFLSAHTDRITDGLNRFLEVATMWWHGFFFKQFYWQNGWEIQTGISVQWCGIVTSEITNGYTDETCPSVIPSVKANIYPLCWHSLPLFLLLLPHPTHLSPPKLQPTTHPNSPPLLNTSTQVSYTFVRGHNNIHSCGFIIFCK